MCVAPDAGVEPALTGRRQRKWKDAELEGQIVAGRYAIDRLIGRGGMGEVYRARDDLLRREVAIKVIRSSDDPRLVERFRREAYLAARFDHPNIVRIFDLGETEDGCLFLVMELLSGERFSELLKRHGPMDVERVAGLLEGIASALDLLHREGIVHRDLKLDNLMLVERKDGPPRPKLLDFGVALAPTDEAPRLTVDGEFVGTPLYSAPEALIGATPDAASDVYSLALAAYQLLTGMAPFEQLEGQQRMQAKLSDDVTPPSRLRPELPPAVDALFASALARDPDLRPAAASDLVAALRGAVVVRRPTPPRWKRSHLYFAGGVVSFLVAALALWLATSL